MTDDIFGQSWIDSEGMRNTIVGHCGIADFVWVERERVSRTFHVKQIKDVIAELQESGKVTKLIA